MTIWVDADNCSLAVRRIIERAAERRRIATVFVAAVPLAIAESDMVSFELMTAGGSADDRIKSQIHPGDLLVTADVPLAYEVVAAGAVVVNPRGDVYTRETVGERKSLRDFATALRAGGANISSRKKRGSRDTARIFAGHFDKTLTRLARNSGVPS